MKPNLTKLETETLEWTLDRLKFFDGVASGRIYKKRVFESLEKKGLVKSIFGYMSDGDGFTIQPERWRPMWTLTPAGVKAATDA